MGEHRVHSQIDVQRDANTVFALVSDPHRLPEWLPGVERILTTSRDLQEGSERTIEVRMYGVHVTSRQRIILYEPPHRFAWKHLEDFVDEKPFTAARNVSTEILLTPSGAGVRIDATVRLTPHGFRARLGFPLIARDIEKQIALALTNLKAMAEKATPRKAPKKRKASARD